MNKRLIIVIICLLGFKSYGQETRRLSVAVLSESMAFPFTRYTPIHPGMEVGYTLKETDKPGLITATNLSMGWYYHARVENAFYVRTEWAWQFKLNDAFTADLYSGIGYMHVFYPGELYELNSSSGEFEKIKQTGRPHALGTIGVGFTYRNSSFCDPFIRQDLGIESPFANGIPVMVHSFLKIGTHIKINRK